MLLQTPLPSAKERIALVDKANHLAKKLQAKVAEAERPVGPACRTESAILLKRRWHDLLMLAGEKNLPTVTKVEDLTSLEGKLREAWAKQLPAAWLGATSSSQADLSKA